MSHPGSMPGSLPFPLGGAVTVTATTESEASVGRAWKLGTDGDRVREGGRFVRVSGLDSIAQDIRCALGAIQEFDADGEPIGEWAFDFTVGIPYRRDILVKGPDMVRVREVFRRAIAARKGVTEVTSLTVEVEPTTRTLTVEFAARADLGQLAGVVAGTVSGVI